MGLPGFSHDTLTRVIIYEFCDTGKIIAANMNDIMIDRERELWFEGEKLAVS
jgi:hypothetical protein